MRAILPRFRFIKFAYAFGALLFVAQSSAQSCAQQPETASPAQLVASPIQPRPKLFISSEHRLPAAMWSALFAALERGLPEAAAKVPTTDMSPEFIRGDLETIDDPTGQRIVTVYLRGNCLPPAVRFPFPEGQSLGWVNKIGGVIVPIIHVECTQVGEAISSRTQYMTSDDRTNAMADAIARVTLHEWIHVATQSPAHDSEGIRKRGFGSRDLLTAAQATSPAGTGKGR
jgi:hypothetical protein